MGVRRRVGKDYCPKIWEILPTDSYELPCHNCDFIVRAADQGVVRSSCKIGTYVLCTMDSNPVMQFCDPETMGRTEYDRIADQVELLNKMGANLVYCGKCRQILAKGSCRCGL